MTLDVRRSIEARGADQTRAAFAQDGPAQHLRRARCLNLDLQGDRYWIRSYLSDKAIRGTAALAETLRVWTTWRTTDDAWFLDATGAIDTQRADRVLRLIELGIIVVEGSPFEQLDTECATSWDWGTTSAAFHFAIRDARWGTPDQLEQHFIARQAVDPDPGPALTHHHDPSAAGMVPLPAPKLTTGVYETMAARISERLYNGEAISLDALARIVHSGLGILDWTDAGVLGVLPHAMTPSGGARNPYEAFVAVRAVDGLEPAVYHYSATQHSFLRVADCPPRLGCLLADLEWIDDAAAVIMLVADFRRTMWKYKHPTAHRVVLVEGGHIAQNLLLAATDEGLGSIPIAAFNDEVVENLLDLDPVHQVGVHAVVVGQRS